MTIAFILLARRIPLRLVVCVYSMMTFMAFDCAVALEFFS
jgi:hypothetical protein